MYPLMLVIITPEVVRPIVAPAPLCPFLGLRRVQNAECDALEPDEHRTGRTVLVLTARVAGAGQCQNMKQWPVTPFPAPAQGGMAGQSAKSEACSIGKPLGPSSSR